MKFGFIVPIPLSTLVVLGALVFMYCWLGWPGLLFMVVIGLGGF